MKQAIDEINPADLQEVVGDKPKDDSRGRLRLNNNSKSTPSAASKASKGSRDLPQKPTEKSRDGSLLTSQFSESDTLSHHARIKKMNSRWIRTSQLKEVGVRELDSRRSHKSCSSAPPSSKRSNDLQKQASKQSSKSQSQIEVLNQMLTDMKIAEAPEQPEQVQEVATSVPARDSELQQET